MMHSTNFNGDIIMIAYELFSIKKQNKKKQHSNGFLTGIDLRPNACQAWVQTWLHLYNSKRRGNIIKCSALNLKWFWNFYKKNYFWGSSKDNHNSLNGLLYKYFYFLHSPLLNFACVPLWWLLAYPQGSRTRVWKSPTLKNPIFTCKQTQTKKQKPKRSHVLVFVYTKTNTVAISNKGSAYFPHQWRQTTSR